MQKIKNRTSPHSLPLPPAKSVKTMDKTAYICIELQNRPWSIKVGECLFLA